MMDTHEPFEVAVVINQESLRNDDCDFSDREQVQPPQGSTVTATSYQYKIGDAVKLSKFGGKTWIPAKVIGIIDSDRRRYHLELNNKKKII